MRYFHFMGYDIPRLAPGSASTCCSPIICRTSGLIPRGLDLIALTSGSAGRADTASPFLPFGGGAYMRLGLHYAMMQAKCFAVRLLQNFIRQCRSGLRIDLENVAAASSPWTGFVSLSSQFEPATSARTAARRLPDRLALGFLRSAASAGLDMG